MLFEEDIAKGVLRAGTRIRGQRTTRSRRRTTLVEDETTKVMRMRPRQRERERDRQQRVGRKGRTETSRGKEEGKEERKIDRSLKGKIKEERCKKKIRMLI